MNSLYIVIVLSCVVALVTADCYYQQGCSDVKNNFKPGQRWRPRNKICYSCYCYEEKVFTIVCREVAYYSSPPLNLTVRAIVAQMNRVPKVSEQVEVLKPEGKYIKCEPTGGPIFNFTTGSFKIPTYKLVSYFYNTNFSSCCSRFSIPEICRLFLHEDIYDKK